MEYFYLVFPLKNGGYAVEFPDIPEAFSEGKTLDECIINAGEVLAIAAEEYRLAKKLLPEPSTANAIWQSSHNSEFYEFRNPDEAVMLLSKKVPNPDIQPVKVNISLTKGELADIDEKARALGLSRSGLFVKGALSYVG